MDEYSAIEQRYGCGLPDVYRALRKQGHFDWHGPDASPDYLFLTDLEWLSLQEIAEYQFFDWQIGGLIPFAISARRDEWCWRRDWQQGAEPPVVLCRRGDTGYGFAPDFRGFLYRILLEEFSGTWLVESFGIHGTQERLRRYVDFVRPYLPERWVGQLSSLANRDWVTLADGTVCVFTREECNRVVQDELAFPHLNEEFYHDTGSPGYKRNSGNPR